MTARLLALVCLFVLGSPFISGAQPPDSFTPLEAELLTRVTTRNVKPGSTIYARATLDWAVPGCTLAQGATIEGTVTAAIPHSAKIHHSQLAVSFERAQCGGSDLQPFGFRLAAVAAPPDPELASVSTDLPAPSESGLHSAVQQTTPALVDAHRFPSSSRVRPGQVLGIPGMKLTVGTGSDNSSVFTRTGYDVALDEHTRLLLLPSSGLPPATVTPSPADDLTASAAASAEVLTVSAPAASSEDATPDPCSSPDCSASLSAEEAAPAEAFLGSIPLASLGFSSRVNAQIFDTSPDEVLAWLSPAQLLITFNPHLLVPRHNEHADGCMRVIRAELADIKTRRILRSVEWRTFDRKQFLWVLPRNRVLVHVGNELRVYAAGLELERRIAVSGPLAFVRVSPDGDTMAIGVVRERHPPQLHELLAVNLLHDPDENVQVLVLNNRFETLASSTSTSDRTAPVLLNEGRISLTAGSPHGLPVQRAYRMQMRRWDNTVLNLGHFESTCPPVLTTLQPDLLFLVTCDTFNGAREYRVIRPDGSTLLRGHSLLRETGQDARADTQGNSFAIRTFQVDQPLLPGEGFRASNLESVDLAIYNAQDGKRLFSLRMRGPAASTAGYAISAGGQVAVLAQDHVEIYTMPKK